MGDDATACRINDLPKVTAIVSSESISQTQAFDMMVRFLQRRPDRQNTNDSHHPHHPHHPHRHYWQDLYHVTETLVVDHNRTTTTTTTNQRQQTQQLETLRTLRLTAATTTPTTPTTLQSQNDTTLPTTHDTAAAHLKEDSTVFEDRRNSMDRQVLVKKEDSFTHDHHDDVDDGTFHRKYDNRDQKAKKKKNKKRHGEENVESSSASKYQ